MTGISITFKDILKLPSGTILGYFTFCWIALDQTNHLSVSLSNSGINIYFLHNTEISQGSQQHALL